MEISPPNDSELEVAARMRRSFRRLQDSGRKLSDEEAGDLTTAEEMLQIEAAKRGIPVNDLERLYVSRKITRPRMPASPVPKDS